MTVLRWENEQSVLQVFFKCLFIMVVLLILSGCSRDVSPIGDQSGKNESQTQQNFDSTNAIYTLSKPLLAIGSSLKGEVSVYNSESELIETQNLELYSETEDKVLVLSPSFVLNQNRSYSFVLRFYSDETPIAYVTIFAELGTAENKTLRFSDDDVILKEGVDTDVLASLSVNEGAIPDLDLDDDGYSNLQEILGNSDAQDKNSIPNGPEFSGLSYVFSDDGNLLTIDGILKDENGVADLSLSLSESQYLEEILSLEVGGSSGDTERSFQMTINPNYIPLGDFEFKFLATNSLEISSEHSQMILIEENENTNVAPIIDFESLKNEAIISGIVDISVIAYDRDGIASLEISRPAGLVNQSEAEERFSGSWDSTTVSDGKVSFVITATDKTGLSQSETYTFTVSNGADLSGPQVGLVIYKPNQLSETIDYKNGETIHGNVKLLVTASDSNTVTTLTLFNKVDLNCSNLENENCALGNDEISTVNFYSNDFDTTQYNDGDTVTLDFLSVDSLGNQSQTSFTLEVQNTPEISDVLLNDEEILITKTGVQNTLSWRADLANSMTIKSGETVLLEESAASGVSNEFTFSLDKSETLDLILSYETTNKDGENRVYTTTQSFFIGVDDDDDGVLNEDDAFPNDASETEDSDGDGFGDNSDCQPNDSAIHPDADEICDGGIDNNCDGVADDDDENTLESSKTTFYYDEDEDGYAGNITTTKACVLPQDYFEVADDCNDSNSAINPAATEICDGIDNDCDGNTDDDDDDTDDALKVTYYQDEDGDGYGDSNKSARFCTSKTGYLLNSSDCNDSNSAINPAASEICDGIDNDCDGNSDDDDDDTDSSTMSTYYNDDDGDGYAGDVTTAVQCDKPTGYFDEATDCNDSNSAINPAASEICDGIDNDCDGNADDDDDDTDSSTMTTYYNDDDGDGYAGDVTTVVQCDKPTGYFDEATDCNDSNSAINPAASEICDGIDNDCDGNSDDDDDDTDTTTMTTYYNDDDGDGYAGDVTTVVQCDKPTGYFDEAEDCNDSDSAINPDASEICDSVDNDCDGNIDDDDDDTLETTKTTFYFDEDEDGFAGEDVFEKACEQPDDSFLLAEDCNDEDSDINPDATEVCDGIDNDCDGNSDDDDDDTDTTTMTTYYNDDDGDGYAGDVTTVVQCDKPTGYFDVAEDCNDSNSAINPAASEICDGIDNDCDGNSDDDDDDTDTSTMSTYYNDDDGDGYAGDVTTAVQCDKPTGYFDVATDCNDSNSAINPAASEVCDGIDNDCDGNSDDDDDDTDSSTMSTYYNDDDGDGYAGDVTTAVQCDKPTGYFDVATDCNDSNSAINPAASEICDGIDNDCDGNSDDDDDDTDTSTMSTYYNDDDGDGYAGDVTTVVQCDKPTGYFDVAEDCNDSNAAINPAATEICDGIDNDCDGNSDDDDDDTDTSTMSTYYNDDDGDGYAGDVTTVVQCDKPTDYFDEAEDCNDSDSAINPDASEICDSVDNDCDGSIDDDDDDTLETTKTTFYFDEDEDGFAGEDVFEKACEQPDDSFLLAEDCNDEDSDINPDATEVCDGIDNDCDGNSDDDDDDTDSTTMSTYYNDDDGDGYAGDVTTAVQCDKPTGYFDVAEDCNDSNSAINPAATEICDGIDNDCDGNSDDDDDDTDTSTMSTYYNDDDGDGYAGDVTTAVQCDKPTGYFDVATDCNDSNSAINPAASEICDGIDNDCDGNSDDDDDDTDTSTMSTYYNDDDGDGYAGDVTTAVQCDKPTGYFDVASDCNDSNSAINPAASEICDGIDNDCDGNSDDDDDDTDTSTMSTYYNDDDGDGYAGDVTTAVQCDKPTGYFDVATDCNDSNSAINPAASEICDGIDNDCDGNSDDDDDDTDSSTMTTYYNDDDGDGYAGDVTTVVQCDKPTGYFDVAEDCNDSNSAINPAATEICDGIDNDCDGNSDDDDDDTDTTTMTTYYNDDDGDGYAGDVTTVVQCDKPTDYFDEAEDCNDSDSAINPDASEICDSVDNDCDGNIDDDDDDTLETTKTTFYFDEDEDGFAGEDVFEKACEQPDDSFLLAEDCNDEDSDINPDATEVCDGIDNDCDGNSDDDDDDTDSTTMTTYYNDDDGDGYAGDVTTAVQCDKPSGYFDVAEDCNDSNSAINPAATEICDGIDNDCDGNSDDDDDDTDTSTMSTYYNDDDGDGYAGDVTTAVQCDKPTGYFDEATDCNDSNSAINPAASEICDGIDNDCDGNSDDDDDDTDSSTMSTYYNDDDGDGYAGSVTTAVQCDKPTGYFDVATDCNDSNSAINPAAPEICDGIDNDCDGNSDDDDDNTDTSTMTTYYNDDDGDGYAGDVTTVVQCDKPTGYFDEATDCNDSNSAINPAASEICDGIDNDCDGNADDDDDDTDSTTMSTYYNDDDGDGYAGDVTTVVQCDKPTGYFDEAEDCNDSNSAINPAASEVCDGIDNDCNGDSDDDDENIDTSTMTTWYSDADEDGYVDFDLSLVQCAQPEFYISESLSEDTDCDDTNADTYPDAVEKLNHIDDDCDSLIDHLSVDEDAPVYYSDSGSITSFTYGDFNGDGSKDLALGFRDKAGTLTSGNPGIIKLIFSIEDNYEDMNGEYDLASSSNYDTIFEGESDGDRAGQVLLSGNLTGSTADELIVSAVYADGSSTGGGAVYMIVGTGDTDWSGNTYSLSDVYDSTSDIVGVKFLSENTDDLLGITVAVGDIDGTGRDNLFLAAPGFDDGGSNRGRVYAFEVYREIGSGITYDVSNAPIQFYGENDGDFLGYNMTVKDIEDGDDTLADMILSSYLYDSSRGRIYGWLDDELASATDNEDISSSSEFEFEGESTGDGFSETELLDFNCDGDLDLVVSSNEYDSARGKAYIFFGDGTGSFSSSSDVEIEGENTGDVFGRLQSLGDLNGDGCDDLSVASTDYNSNRGAVYIFYGESSPSSIIAISDDISRIYGVGTNTYLGSKSETFEFGNKTGISILAPKYYGSESGALYFIESDF